MSFAIGGPIEEGALTPLVATSIDHALRYFWLGYCHYVDSLAAGDYSRFVLYWRELPVLTHERGWFVLWARLLVSDKPCVP